MRIFIYEYTCSGGLASPSLPSSLRVEGWAMLSALMQDFAQVPGVETVTLLDQRRQLECSHGACRRIAAGEEPAVFRELAWSADYTLIIAPELDDILPTRCLWVTEVGGRLLGPSPSAVRVTGDKLTLCRHLLAHGVPTPESRTFRPGETLYPWSFPLVWKPRYGAGSQATFLIRDLEQLRSCASQATAEGWRGEALLQPFVPGCPASVAFLMGMHQLVPLLPTAQRLSADGRFRYLGGTIPLPADLGQRTLRLARQAVETVAGLQGYVGVDLVLGEAADGREDWVIEINPRLTTSYVGLRALAETNLAQAMLAVALGEEIPAVKWRSGVVDFRADGRVMSARH